MEYFWIFTKPSTFVLAGRSPCEDKKTSIPGALKALISLPTSPTSPLSKILMSFLSDGRSFIGSSSALRQKSRIFPEQARAFSRTVCPHQLFRFCGCLAKQRGGRIHRQPYLFGMPRKVFGSQSSSVLWQFI